MNQRLDPNDNRPANPTAWSDGDAVRSADPAGTRTGQPGVAPMGSLPLGDPLAQRSAVDPTLATPRARRSSWPVLIILLAGLVLALLVWLPAEMSNNASDTATQPAPAAEGTTQPAATTPPAATATPPAAAPTTPPPAATAPAETAPATGTAPATTAPATGAAPATGTAP